MGALKQLVKIPGVRWLWRKWPIGSIDTRVQYDIWQQSAFAYGLHSAAFLANRLGLRELTAIEFGVAHGMGLAALENHANLIGNRFGVRFSVVGFDSGSGMPSPVDYRDLPHVWSGGYYKMDEAAVRAKLKDAELIIGPVGETVPSFLERSPAPVGFISFDLDYYSSTKHAFQIFEGGNQTRLPRIWCYFDDTIWPERACFNEFTGEYLAINEFNAEHEFKKLAKMPYLNWTRSIPAAWNDQMYVFHDFKHPEYNTNLTPPDGR
jgi:hypothetical protein